MSELVVLLVLGSLWVFVVRDSFWVLCGRATLRSSESSGSSVHIWVICQFWVFCGCDELGVRWGVILRSTDLVPKKSTDLVPRLFPQIRGIFS